MHKSPRPRRVMVLLLFLTIATPLLAQRLDGTIRGTVTDSTGAVLPNAKVVVTNVATGVTHETTTSNSGIYNVPNLLIGNYTVSVIADKFHTYKRLNVQVLAARIVVVDASLKVGTMAEVVEIQAGAEAVQSDSSQITTTFTGRTVTEIPTATVGSVSVQNLAVYAPNTTTGLGGTSGNGGSVGGLRGRQNSFTIDGTTNNDGQVSTSSLEVIPDAVQEFSLSSNQFSAEYGSAAGGQFNVVTKSGTNDAHGAVYWYSNNRNLNAETNLEKFRGKGKDRYDSNRLGGNVGGPIIRNKLFFFAAYEFQGIGLKGSSPTASGPTADGLSMLNTLAVNQAVKDLMAQFPAAGSATSTQTICRVSNRVSRTPAVGDQCLSVPFGPLSATAPNFSNNHQWLTNTDWMINDKHQLRFRHIKDRNRGPALGEFPQAQFTASTATDNRKMILNEVWNISNVMVNDFRVTGSRFVTDSGVFNTALAANYPTILFTGAVTIGPLNNLPQNRITNSYQIADALSWVRGAHTFKWGGEYAWFTGPNTFLQNARGQYQYINFQEFVNDFIPATNNATLQGIGSGLFSQNRKNMSWYLQNDWKITNKLTVNLGLRWEFFGVPKGANLNALDSVSDCPNCAPNPYTPLIWHEPKNDYNNFAPRIGFAWDPTGSGRWAIRGGFGMGYDHIPGNFYLNGAPPQFQAVLNPQTACAGAFGTPPAWCPSNGTGQFLGNGAMKGIVFAPPATAALARSITGNLMSDNTSPRVYSWSIGVQRELFSKTTVDIRYLGTRAYELPVQIQLNAVDAFDLGAQPLPTYFKASDIPATVSLSAPSRAQFLAARARPYGANGFTGVITAFPGVGESKYHGGSVELSRRVSTGLTFRASYTLSRTRDNSTNDLFTSQVNPRRPEDFRNVNLDWARSALDVRNKVAVTWVYDIPKLNLESGFGRALLDGWLYSGSYLFQGGQPVTILSGIDSNGNFDSAPDRALLNPNGSGRTGSTVSRVCRSGTGATSVASTCTDANTVGYVANDPTAKYVQAEVGVKTTSARNTENSGHFNIFNMALAKNSKAGEKLNIQFRAEFFNIFNHRNFTLGNSSIFPTTSNARTTTYSNISASSIGQKLFLNDKQFDGGGRRIQLGVRFQF